MRVVLIATYELGHQPLQLAVPAARLRARGHEVRCRDLQVEEWDPELVAWADRIAFSVPMHTATQIARPAIASVRAERPGLPIAGYGLYAQMLEGVADRVFAGETDAALVAWVEDLDGAIVHLGRDAAAPGAPLPARDLLPPLDRYAHLVIGGEERTVGYVEASHGCAHRCRHCPVPVVYDGGSASSNTMPSSPTSRNRSMPEPVTSPSATPTSSTACTTRSESCEPCTSSSPTSPSIAP